ncbi:hypothetical protein PENANT_c090G03597 [Penicillium antarcticum]|uniref:F-box domain-containing protein n=1 Tax=Penicillium antarcticum TaxID=416450 RepID=A0A1V6PM42_9EURO|nr:hypothetical protein PENANT_c090G03597 [Penicillium antarcticum]
MAERKASSLLSLPTEIIQSILAYIPSRESSENVEMTCKELKELLIPVYRVRYGHDPAPSVPVSSRCWKRFAIQHENYRRHSDHIREETVNGFLKSYLEYPDQFHLTYAEDVIYYLHNNPFVHSRGVEAIVAALNIQGRYQDSNAFLSKYRGSSAMLLETVALLQARFNLHFPVAWSTISSEVLERCLLAAATSGNMELFIYLKQLLLETGKVIQVHPAANAAIQADRVEILRDLQSSFCVEFHTLPLGSLMQVAVKFGSANAVQFLLELGPGINLETPYKLALSYCNLDVLRRLANYLPRVSGTYLSDGQLEIAVVLTNDLTSWSDKSNIIEYLVMHASVDINATGRDGLAAVHIAAIDNNTDALMLFKHLGANMTSLGEVEQTPAEIALCHGHNIPSIGCSSFPIELFATKREMAKSILRKFCDAMSESQRKCPGFDRALNDAESKLADIWAKKIGLETLRSLLRIVDTPFFKTIEKFLKIMTDFGEGPVEAREEQLQDMDGIKDILNKYLNPHYPDWFLTRLACYLRPRLELWEVEYLKFFVNSKTGRALHLRKCSFAREETKVWIAFKKALSRI